ncbi:hypothetical protein HMN09_01184200 [Mycena chlorophos]|uniref:TLC domain-containing protein n=1 Tax=Mycena chlorophos TaxID=658473 RepID=A0A8H6VVY1_MYCCL|nr:hypothetical protein HMN09_01184200 [Mycena chlorophos]
MKDRDRDATGPYHSRFVSSTGGGRVKRGLLSTWKPLRSRFAPSRHDPAQRCILTPQREQPGERAWNTSTALQASETRHGTDADHRRFSGLDDTAFPAYMSPNLSFFPPTRATPSLSPSMESPIDATTLIFLSTLYYFIEQLLRYGLRRYDEPFYASLYASRKDTVFFGIAMGLLISAISTPSCARGAWSAWTALHLGPGATSTPWTLDEDTQRCVTARAILWISELNRLDLYPLYVVHHAGALLSLLSFLHLQWPVLPIISIFATLVSEIPGDMLWMLSALIDSLPTPSADGLTVFSRKAEALQKFKQHLIHFNVVQYTVMRGAGILFVVWLLAFNPLSRRGPLDTQHPRADARLCAARAVCGVLRAVCGQAVEELAGVSLAASRG